LASHNCLGFWYWRRKDLWRLWGARCIEEVPVSARLIVNNGQALRKAALAGVGVFMQPEVLVSGDIAAGF
jgi:DNA-binding transcriptional LysR family regulator